MLNTIALVDIRPEQCPPVVHCDRCNAFNGKTNISREDARRHAIKTRHTVRYDITARTIYTPRTDQ